MVPPQHPVQRIASRYLHQWLAQVRNAPALYVEGFASLAAAERVRVLPAGSETLLIQEDPVLAAQLRACFAEGGVEVVEAPFWEAIDLVANRAAAIPNALLWLDPPAPVHLSLDAVRVLATLPSLDVWIRFPHEDLQKLASFRSTPVADLPPHFRRVVEGCGRLLGDPRGSWLAEWRQIEAEHGSRAAADAMARQFGERLVSVAEERAFKATELDLQGTGTLHLFGLASNPRRLLAMNAAVEELELDDFVRWPGERFRLAPPTPLAEALELFPGATAPTSVRRHLNEAALAEMIASRFLGKRVTWDEILRNLLDTDVLPDDPIRALRLLRRSGRALCRSLRELASCANRFSPRTSCYSAAPHPAAIPFSDVSCR
jgi:hypothetical protein